MYSPSICRPTIPQFYLMGGCISPAVAGAGLTFDIRVVRAARLGGENHKSMFARRLGTVGGADDAVGRVG